MRFDVYHHFPQDNHCLNEIKDILLDHSQKLQSIMATIKEISEKADQLQAALDAEQVQIQAAIDTLNATIADLQTQLTDGGTAEERQAVLDKLTSVVTDLEATIP